MLLYINDVLQCVYCITYRTLFNPRFFVLLLLAGRRAFISFDLHRIKFQLKLSAHVISGCSMLSLNKKRYCDQQLCSHWPKIVNANQLFKRSLKLSGKRLWKWNGLQD